MRGHCNKAHEWKYSEEHPTNWLEVRAQTFFRGFYQQYVIVQVEDGFSEATRASRIEECNDDTQQILREMKEARARDAERLKIADESVEKSDNTGWWNHTK
jgi:uncharacterized protein YcaQ